MTTHADRGPTLDRPAPRTLTARTPEDVLAAVPLVLGFVPEDSVAMLTFEAEHAFHARLDLPTDRAGRRAAAQVLLEPSLRHRVRRVFFVLYTDDAERARSCTVALLRAFEREGIEVIDVLRSDGRCWFPVPLDAGEPPDPGVPYDVEGHLFTAQAVGEGRVTLGSRAELAGTVAADDEAAAAVGAAVGELGRRVPAADPVAWVRETVDRLIASGEVPDARTAAGLLLAVRDPVPRDAALLGVGRAEAERRLGLWSALVRAAPADLVAAPAAVLAFHAWLAGHGALAWCALDRAAEGDPGCSLADVVAEALQRALPPQLWEEGGEEP